MNSKDTLSITEARKNIFDLVKSTTAGAKYFLTERGKVKSVLMSADEFDAWQETLEVMSDPQLVKDIKEAEKDIQSGNFKDWTSLEDLKRELLISGKLK